MDADTSAISISDPSELVAGLDLTVDDSEIISDSLSNLLCKTFKTQKAVNEVYYKEAD